MTGRARGAWKRMRAVVLVAASMLVSSAPRAASIVVLEKAFKPAAFSANGSALVGSWDSPQHARSHSALWKRDRGVVTYDLMAAVVWEGFFDVSSDGTVMLATVGTHPITAGSRAQLWTEADGVVADMSAQQAIQGQSVSGDGTTILGFDSISITGEDWPFASPWTYSEAAGPLHAGGIYTSVLAGRYDFISEDGSTVVFAGPGPPPSTALGHYRWSASTGIEWLTSIPGDAVVRGVSSDTSVMVGTLSTLELFRWSDGEGIAVIDPPPASSFDELISMHLSTDGQLVTGAYRDPGTQDRHIFIWSEAGGLVLVDEVLASLGIELIDVVVLSTIGASDDGSLIAGTFSAAGGEGGPFVIDLDPTSPAQETVRIDAGSAVSLRALGGRFATGGVTFTMDVDAPGHVDVLHARLEPGELDGALPDAAGLVALTHPQTALASWSIEHDAMITPGAPVELAFTYPGGFTPEEEARLRVVAFSGGAWGELPVTAHDPSARRIVAEAGALPEAVVVVVPTEVVPSGALLAPIAGSILGSTLVVLRRRRARATR